MIPFFPVRLILHYGTSRVLQLTQCLPTLCSTLMTHKCYHPTVGDGMVTGRTVRFNPAAALDIELVKIFPSRGMNLMNLASFSLRPPSFGYKGLVGIQNGIVWSTSVCQGTVGRALPSSQFQSLKSTLSSTHPLHPLTNINSLQPTSKKTRRCKKSPYPPLLTTQPSHQPWTTTWLSSPSRIGDDSPLTSSALSNFNGLQTTTLTTFTTFEI